MKFYIPYFVIMLLCYHVHAYEPSEAAIHAITGSKHEISRQDEDAIARNLIKKLIKERKEFKSLTPPVRGEYETKSEYQTRLDYFNKMLKNRDVGFPGKIILLKKASLKYNADLEQFTFNLNFFWSDLKILPSSGLEYRIYIIELDNFYPKFSELIKAKESKQKYEALNLNTSFVRSEFFKELKANVPHDYSYFNIQLKCPCPIIQARQLKAREEGVYWIYQYSYDHNLRKGFEDKTKSEHYHTKGGMSLGYYYEPSFINFVEKKKIGYLTSDNKKMIRSDFIMQTIPAGIIFALTSIKLIDFNENKVLLDIGNTKPKDRILIKKALFNSDKSVSFNGWYLDKGLYKNWTPMKNIITCRFRTLNGKQEKLKISFYFKGDSTYSFIDGQDLNGKIRVVANIGDDENSVIMDYKSPSKLNYVMSRIIAVSGDIGDYSLSISRIGDNSGKLNYKIFEYK